MSFCEVADAKVGIQVSRRKFYTHIHLDYIFLFFFREFQPMTSASDDSSLLSDQDTNQFLV